jgi:hypothetical protein
LSRWLRAPLGELPMGVDRLCIAQRGALWLKAPAAYHPIAASSAPVATEFAFPTQRWDDFRGM